MGPRNGLIQIESVEELGLIDSTASHHQHGLLANHEENGITSNPPTQPTSSAASVISVDFAMPETGLLARRLRSSRAPRQTDGMCHERTHAPQQRPNM
jgi:hypothetical protein